MARAQYKWHRPPIGRPPSAQTTSETLVKTPDGRKALADVAPPHANVLLPAELRNKAIEQLQSVQTMLTHAQPATPDPSSPASAA